MRSAALLMFRRRARGLEVFLVHPGGPFFAKRDAGAWSLPKGEVGPDEEPLEVAQREFAEETGQPVEACAPKPRFVALGEIRQRGGKRVLAWGFEGDWPEGAELRSNTFELEWPPRSGRKRDFPEVDRAGFLSLEEAREKLNPAQVALLERLVQRVGAAGD